MTRHVATTELKAKLSEILGAVERGEAIDVTRHGKTIARILPPQDNERERRRKAVHDLMEWRKTLPKTGITIEEILSARDEGRK
ncbi:MAG TPA: type II toxin-antitoxin system prevent-host-death family antitoxin [Rhizobiaceae bacterium]|nr:type II toxin-antitoxin system prevent-host-death family antitoxin [Rhizobiaceae bacterium]